MTKLFPFLQIVPPNQARMIYDAKQTKGYSCCSKYEGKQQTWVLKGFPTFNPNACHFFEILLSPFKPHSASP